ncbi:hypothetical protein B0H19DRAFT_1148408, partial [Mycena capillaripes]
MPQWVTRNVFQVTEGPFPAVNIKRFSDAFRSHHFMHVLIAQPRFDWAIAQLYKNPSKWTQVMRSALGRFVSGLIGITTRSKVAHFG